MIILGWVIMILIAWCAAGSALILIALITELDDEASDMVFILGLAPITIPMYLWEKVKHRWENYKEKRKYK